MINRVDTTNWQEFRIDDLFDLRKGERLVEIDRIIGHTPLVTASFYNNGITSHIDFKTFENKKKLFKNKITVDMFANVFFHSYDYFSDDNIHSLVLKSDNKLNIYVNLFLVSIIKKLQPRYGFGRQVRLQRLVKEIIKLPAKQNSKGEYEPDWKFMEGYIKSISKKVDFSDAIQMNNRELPPLQKASFKEFNLSDIFIVERGKRLTKLNQISGEIAYISSTKDDNGVDNYVMPPDNMKIYQNALTLNNSGSVGYCFYHSYKFVASDHCTILLLKNKKIVLNNNIAIFLKSLLEKMKHKYSFGREINNERINKEIINLPAKQNSNGEYEPDWQFMEDYIKSLPYSSNL